MKTCPKCHERKAAALFHRSAAAKDGRYSYCVACSKTAKQISMAKPGNKERWRACILRWKKAHPESVAISGTNTRLKRKYGITLKEYKRRCASQGYRCAICRKKKQRALHTDHDHKSKLVRGMLCTNCNTGLGLFMDSPKLLGKAKSYLEQRKLQ